jgi:LacI family transcriptional regulator
MKSFSSKARSELKSRSGPSRLTEVAALAAVSPATVSRAFNAPHLLTAETRARVALAAQKLNYLPDGLARSLRRNRSMVVGAVMPSLRHAYFATTVEGIQSELTRSGYTLLLGTAGFDQSAELAAVRAMIRQGVDGFVLVGRQHDPELLPLLCAREKPFMLTWCYDTTLPSVGFDHRLAIQAAVDHLVDLGHEEFVAVMAWQTLDREQERLAGIEDALARRGMRFSRERAIFAGGSAPQDGRNAFRAARARFPQATAVVCANDLLAAGVLMECSALSLSVPGQLSVVGYGDLDIAGAMNPPITTVRAPAEEMGALATRSLLAKLAGEADLEHIELATELLVRASTGPARSL